MKSAHIKNVHGRHKKPLSPSANTLLGRSDDNYHHINV